MTNDYVQCPLVWETFPYSISVPEAQRIYTSTVNLRHINKPIQLRGTFLMNIVLINGVSIYLWWEVGGHAKYGNVHIPPPIPQIN